MMKKHTCLLITSMFLALPAYAVPQCSPTSTLAPYDYPGARIIPTTNNLVLPTGKSIPAEGQQLTITGRVLDKQCKPVPEAMVELWQTGPFGRWMVANREDLSTPHPVFAGAGRTYTDANGNFTFITAFPAPLRYAAPNVNIRIKPEKMAEYKSALFFAGDERNEKEPVFKRRKPNAKQDISIVVEANDDDMLEGNITVVLPGNAPYRTY